MQDLAEWIAVDWDTSYLRVWMMGPDGLPFAQDSSDKGIASLAQGAFESALLELVDPYLASDHVTPVICTGMVGAREGWLEAPYVATPCAPPSGQSAVTPACTDPRLSVHILPGVKQMSPPDVMRGEAAKIAGVLSSQPDFDGILCLAGTHTKWVHISAGEIVSFQTCITGEIFALLSQQSVLRHTVTSTGWDQGSFLTGVANAMDRPQAFAAQLFGMHAAELLLDTPADAARARLSGLLIGLELAGTKPYWLGRHVAILGVNDVAAHYRIALAEQGIQAEMLESIDFTLAGLTSAYSGYKGANT
ncbi:2-dehydro-3-deoxygalactonokinase [uncultured Sulfitobacter sp.]|uniref:2-dehydro-3-deoxygalactonokinase n=1 Tax=uncultured Sulfitobacter sp. TaxID=191468 RepID=UPI00261D75DC|nr:2-dehydro-3-deoxygalactonokinase [uncultured Sulfitobacter sp.]